MVCRWRRVSNNLPVFGKGLLKLVALEDGMIRLRGTVATREMSRDPVSELVWIERIWAVENIPHFLLLFRDGGILVSSGSCLRDAHLSRLENTVLVVIQQDEYIPSFANRSEC